MIQHSTCRISVELVPRDHPSLRNDLEQVQRLLPQLTTINIPDLARFPLRSWEGCGIARERFPHAIPHIRARDIAPDQPLPMAEELVRHGIREVLVVSGDEDPGQQATGSTALELIARFKRELPDIVVYAAVDPYRVGFRQEYDYLQRKLEAGADGFFTQPFFDQRLLEIYADILNGYQVFWGVSPVISEKSRGYWEKRNLVFFPREFAPTMAWNRGFARRVLAFVRQNGGNAYFMPIRIDLAEYFDGLLD